MAVRSALGAGQGRLVRQLFTESLVLGLRGAVAGVALARGCIALLLAYGPAGVPRLERGSPRRRWRSAFAVLHRASLSSIVFGLVPAWRAREIDINTPLKEAVRGAGARGSRDIVRSSLIAAKWR